MGNKLRAASSWLIHETKGNYTLIILVGFVAHGLLLLNDAAYWDGWLIYAAKFLDRWELTYGIYADRGGLPLYTFFHWLLYQSPAFIFGYKLTAFLFILFSAVFIYKITCKLLDDRRIALFLSLLALTYPANQAVVELIVIPYLLSYFLFWLGSLLMVKATFEKPANPLLVHIAALLCLLLSFRMYSLLVYAYGLLAVLFLVWHWKQGTGLGESLTSFLRTFAAYISLPILFWFGNAWFFPPSGPYVNSDAFVLDPVVFDLAAVFVTKGVVGQIAESLSNLVNPFVLLIALLLAGLVAWGAATKRSTETRYPNLLWFLLAGAGLFVCGVFPYVIVGRSLELHGWATRNAVLIAVPIAMVLVGVLFLGVRQWSNKRAQWLPLFVLSLLVVLFSAETIKFYANWQLRAIKDHSVVANFRDESEITEHTTVFFVYDNLRVGGESKYRLYEYFGMFALAKPDKERVGFDVNYYSYEEYLFSDNPSFEELFELWFPNLDRNGCQAEMYISQGSTPIDALTIPRYFYYRYFRIEKLDSFVKNVTELDFVAVDSPNATNCQR
jgi:hypothetical protein